MRIKQKPYPLTKSFFGCGATALGWENEKRCADFGKSFWRFDCEIRMADVAICLAVAERCEFHNTNSPRNTVTALPPTFTV